MTILGARFAALLLAASITLALPLAAGELSPDLQARLAAKIPAGEKIPVWIKLPRVDDPRAFKASLSARHASRADRHQEAISRLKLAHADRQAGVLRQLQSLVDRGQAARVRPRWIANLIEVDVSPAQLQALAARDDIELITTIPTLELIEPESVTQSTADAATVTTNQVFIKADSAWKAGYTGAGRLVCSFDTGIDGDHPALFENWKGNDGDSAAAWFDPLDNEPFPHTYYNSSHGTHVLGIMVGRDDILGDTIGVAPDAKWISAAVIDIQGAPILDAFEWAADPDGNPNTVDDVPDVINHSWGIKDASCIDVFYDMVDNLEALGIVNIFAAGNEGPNATTIRNPADRALDSLDCFAVGSISHTVIPPTISTSSSRGPSPCNGARKPNVSAPGAAIRSSVPGTGYGFLGGTSMAAPHVSGLIALLRQKNPNATVDQIKAAILTSAPDFGYPLPDNTFGWGIIDCMEALRALPAPTPGGQIRVWSADHPPIGPGDTVTATVVLQNQGTTVTSVTGALSGGFPAVTILDGSVTFGTAPQNDTVRSVDFIQFVVSDTLSLGSIIPLDFQISGTGYSVPTKLFVLVEPGQSRLQVDHTANNIKWTVTNYGTYGLANGSGSFFPHNGLGFQTAPSTVSEIFESAFLIGRSMTEISDGARNAAAEPDGDFRVTPGGNIELLQPGPVADEETYARFDDQRAENPLGVGVIQQTYQFADPGYENFIVIRYIITNISGAPLTGLRAGLYFDWDVLGNYTSNAGAWDISDSLLWAANNVGGTISNYRGLKLLDGPLQSAFTGDAIATTYYDGIGDGWTETEKWAAMLSGFTTSETFRTAGTDIMSVLTAGPIDLAPLAADTVAFAILTSPTKFDLTVNSFTASDVYDQRINTCCIGTRGNADGDPLDATNIGDIVYLVNYLYRGGPLPVCREEGNSNGDPDGTLNIGDVTYLVSAIFLGGPPLLDCSVTAP